MIKLSGKYNNAIAYASQLDESSAAQIQRLLDQSFVSGSIVRFMPDVHAGAGCTIGTTMTIQNKIVPNLVGVDISCGMLVTKLSKRSIVDLDKLDRVIHDFVPCGKEKQTRLHPFSKDVPVEDMKIVHEVRGSREMLGIGSLGGGNHFIELNTNENGDVFLVIHCGSRHLGLRVANRYQDEAIRQMSHCEREEIRELVDRLKAEGRRTEVQSEIAKLRQEKMGNVPPELAYLTGDLMQDYLNDMKIMGVYANRNRAAIADTIIRNMNWEIEDSFETLHNYLDTDNMILRKGAVSAQKGERLIIPINMRDGSLICLGKGNPDWNYSAPHGAGRLLSRRQAREMLRMEDFKQSMLGIYTSCINQETLDESPMAYKPMKEIVDNISDTVEIIDTIKPIYNFKAVEERVFFKEKS